MDNNITFLRRWFDEVGKLSPHKEREHEDGSISCEYTFEAFVDCPIVKAYRAAATGVAAVSPSPEPPKHVLAHKEQRNAWWYFVCVCGAEIGPYFNEDYGSDAFEVHVAAPAVSLSPRLCSCIATCKGKEGLGEGLDMRVGRIVLTNLLEADGRVR